MPYKNEEDRKKNSKKYYENNKEKILEKDKIYYQKNRERIILRNSEYDKRNFERVSRNHSEYRKKHSEEARLRTKKWIAEHSEQAKEYQKEYRKTHDNSEYLKNWNMRNKETRAKKAKKYSYRKNIESYGITVEEYEAMNREQGGACAICGTVPQKERLHIDHDHKTGKIRKLLCRYCNLGIGNLKDSPILLRKAADYLEKGNET